MSSLHQGQYTYIALLNTIIVKTNGFQHMCPTWDVILNQNNDTHDNNNNNNKEKQNLSHMLSSIDG